MIARSHKRLFDKQHHRKMSLSKPINHFADTNEPMEGVDHPFVAWITGEPEGRRLLLNHAGRTAGLTVLEKESKQIVAIVDPRPPSNLDNARFTANYGNDTGQVHPVSCGYEVVRNVLCIMDKETARELGVTYLPTDLLTYYSSALQK